MVSNLCFILGAPRSGTTWLWGLLESFDNSEVFINGEKINDKYTTSESGVYTLNPKNAKKLITDFTNKTSKMVIEKTPSHLLSYKQIMNDFPNAKFIFIDRHPISIVNSMLKSDIVAFDNFDIKKCVETYKDYFNHIINLRLNSEIFITSYEKLFTKPKEELELISNYLGLEGDIEEIINNNKNTKVLVPGAFRRGVLKSYNTDLEPSELRIIKNSLSNEILEYENYWINKNN